MTCGSDGEVRVFEGLDDDDFKTHVVAECATAVVCLVSMRSILWCFFIYILLGISPNTLIFLLAHKISANILPSASPPTEWYTEYAYICL